MQLLSLTKICQVSLLLFYRFLVMHGRILLPFNVLVLASFLQDTFPANIPWLCVAGSVTQHPVSYAGPSASRNHTYGCIVQRPFVLFVVKGASKLYAKSRGFLGRREPCALCSFSWMQGGEGSAVSNRSFWGRIPATCRKQPQNGPCMSWGNVASPAWGGS